MSESGLFRSLVPTCGLVAAQARGASEFSYSRRFPRPTEFPCFVMCVRRVAVTRLEGSGGNCAYFFCEPRWEARVGV